MENLLTRLDMFGHIFNFTVFNKRTHRTYVGGILTILTICCTFASTLYFGKNFWFKTNPNTNNDRIQYLSYPKYIINKSNFMFGFRVEDSQLNFFDESSYFEFKVIYNNSTMTKNNISGYITEKLFDSLFAGCVPIYWGEPNIQNIVPSSCFIDFRQFVNTSNPYQELYQYLSKMTEQDYLAYQEAGRQFLASAAFKPYSPEAFADAILGPLQS